MVVVVLVAVWLSVKYKTAISCIFMKGIFLKRKMYDLIFIKLLTILKMFSIFSFFFFSFFFFVSSFFVHLPYLLSLTICFQLTYPQIYIYIYIYKCWYMESHKCIDTLAVNKYTCCRYSHITLKCSLDSVLFSNLSVCVCVCMYVCIYIVYIYI